MDSSRPYTVVVIIVVIYGWAGSWSKVRVDVAHPAWVTVVVKVHSKFFFVQIVSGPEMHAHLFNSQSEAERKSIISILQHGSQYCTGAGPIFSTANQRTNKKFLVLKLKY